jgi:Cd2+/Zn2+-exporting ATPase
MGFALAWRGASEAVADVSFAVAIAFGALLVGKRALVSVSARMLDMNVLMSIAVVGAAALGEWGEGATVFFLFALGGLLESRSLERTRRSIRGLMELAPETARVERDGTLVSLPLSEVTRGDLVTVRPGERVPVDGVISTGASAFDESAVTGESVPVEKAEGAQVFAGTLNTTGLVTVTTTAASSESTLARIVYLVEEAQASRAPSERFVDAFSRIYTPAVIIGAAAVAIVPTMMSLASGSGPGPWEEWVNRALVMLVVSCPCALVISTPVSIVSGITRASEGSSSARRASAASSICHWSARPACSISM